MKNRALSQTEQTKNLVEPRWPQQKTRNRHQLRNESCILGSAFSLKPVPPLCIAINRDWYHISSFDVYKHHNYFLFATILEILFRGTLKLMIACKKACQRIGLQTL